ncbi:putative hydrolase [Sphingomonas changbaiensis NBRC 104936]|uniref:Palmitoyl-protein thioesterase ABHD10, mitochondrial n=1 Tax=Sphingomonas changbaiensis NBRC 104936 TaxID=1219043 RepID=A0A0E9MR73_9SPHN|nr:alpha/beta hydrolase [Sphingomonas changbaiensis]GAO40049.1 putative hydrolase [Sphingomonas changbaiensis NBRC 104936]
MNTPTLLERPDRPRLAYHLREGRGPTFVFLPGYASDMAGTKAVALDAWAEAEGRAMLRFDYSGCGESEGRFEDGTLAVWRDDALALIDGVTEGPLVLVGSSMGGWITLLVAEARPHRIAAFIGIAAAPDFTDWGFSQDEKMALLAEGRLERPSDYGPPLVTTRVFWQSGEGLRMLHREVAIDCPVRLLHGQRDPDVPWHHSTHLAGQLRSADVQTILVKDGDHRLSRPQDLDLLIRVAASIVEMTP